MAWTAPRTWTAGEVVTGSIQNTHIRDNLLETATAKAMSAGDLFYATGSGALARLPIGAAGSVLRSTGSAPAWNTADYFPWVVNIDSYDISHGNSGWASRFFDANAVYGSFLRSNTAQNDAVWWYVPLAAGTYSFTLVYIRGTSTGIYSVRIDSVEVGTVDSYGTAQYNTVGTVTGVSVATTGRKEIRLVMASKNASSSGYRGDLQHLTILRTA